MCLINYRAIIFIIPKKLVANTHGATYRYHTDSTKHPALQLTNSINPTVRCTVPQLTLHLSKRLYSATRNVTMPESKKSSFVTICFVSWLQLCAIETNAFALLPAGHVPSCTLSNHPQLNIKRIRTSANHPCTSFDPGPSSSCFRRQAAPMYNRKYSSSLLHAAPTSNNNSYNHNQGSHHSSSSRNNAFRTAMESAVIVEWEPVSELDRRIDEGIHYQHYIDGEELQTQTPSNRRRGTGAAEDVSNIQSVKGIFCGIKSTQEEFSRLKSADPSDPCA